MPFALGYEDFVVKAAALMGGGFSASLPLSNVQTDDPQEVAATIDATIANTQLSIDLGLSRPVGVIVVGPVNLSPGATWRVRSYSDLAMTTVLFDSGVLTVEGSVVDWSDVNSWLEWEDENFWYGFTESDVPELPLYLIATVPAADAVLGNAQYWKITIEDTGNIDGRVTIGRVCLMRIYRPHNNYSPDGNEFSFEWLTDQSMSLGGLTTYFERGFRRRLRLSWPQLDEAEVFADWYRIALRSGISKQIFVIPKEADTVEMLRKRAFLATFTQTPSIAQLGFDRASTSLDVVEVK